MNQLDLSSWGVRGSLVIAVGYVLLLVLFRIVRVTSPNLKQLGVLLVFLAAVCPWSMPIEVACLPTQTDEAVMDAPPNTNETLVEQDDFDLLSHSELSVAEILSPTNFNAVASEATTDDFSHSQSVRHNLARYSSNSLRLIWLLGAVFLVARGMCRYLAFLQRTKNKAPVEPHWQSEWEQLQKSRLATATIPLLATQILGPMLAWLPRGLALLVPAAYWQVLTHRERRTILRHELAHFERGDIARSCLIRLLSLPFWFHPLSWQLVAWFDEAAEDACDRAAVGNSDAIPYARALQRLAANPPAITLALGQSAQSHPLVQRVRRVLNPSHQQDSVMKSVFTATALAALALASIVQIRLVAEETSPATVESVKAEVESLEGDLVQLKEDVEQAKKDAGQLKERVESHLQELKELAADPNALSAEATKLVDELKAGDEASKTEASQLLLLEKIAKLDEADEKLLVCGYLAKESSNEAVRRKAIEIAALMGEDGLPVFAHAYESLPAADRLFAVDALAKNKETHAAVFARLAQDAEEQVRVAAVTAGLKCEEPLIFLALAVESNEGLADILLPRLAILEGDDLRLALFAAALKGPEKFLPEVVTKAAELKEGGYPIIAVVFQRKTPESRTAIVKAFAKSAKPLEKLLVEKTLTDEDATLREAAEKGT